MNIDIQERVDFDSVYVGGCFEQADKLCLKITSSNVWNAVELMTGKTRLFSSDCKVRLRLDLKVVSG